MIDTKVSVVESLEAENLREMLNASGPCITVLLPAYRPGAQAKSMAAILKTNLQAASRELAARRVGEPTIAQLLDPLEKLTRDDDFLAGSRWGRAIFRSSDRMVQFQLIGPINQALTVAAGFNLRPILPELHIPATFYVLKISSKRVKLFRCSHLQPESMSLPKGVPETLEQALEFKPPDHDLENRSAAGASIGALRGVRFGTGSGRETQQTYLADFYKAVDRGVRERLNGTNAPLVLAGVHEDSSIYAMANTYPNLLSNHLPGEPAGATEELSSEAVEQAYWIIRSDFVEKSKARLMEMKERLSPARFSVHLEDVLRAAMDGRVDSLYIDETARRMGVVAGRANWGEEDLLNRAAIETILHGGSVFSLPTDHMPDGMPVAAIFRW